MKRKGLLLSLLLLAAFYFTINVYCYSTDTELSLDKNAYCGLGDRIDIKIKAPSLNLAKNAAEHLELQVYTNIDTKGFSIYIQETEANSGVFKGQLKFSLKESDSKLRILKVISGIKIYIRYNDLIEKTTWNPDDADIRLDKTTYGGYGVRPFATVTDNDLNLDPLNKEELYIVASSKSNTNGIKVKLIEKTPDSGVFTGDFGLAQTAPDESSEALHVSFNDTITIAYNDITCTSGKPEIRTYSSIWKTITGTVKLDKSSYIGLYSTATVSVTDQDLNLRPDYKDVARVRITSKTDPQGFIVLANETGVNKGVFTGTFNFDTSSTDSEKKVIKICPTDTITAAYTDENNSNNKADTVNTATSSFQFSDAKIVTSAINDKGTGNMLDITINEADANITKSRDRIIAKVGSGNSTDDLTIYLEETGSNTGSFKCKLYFSENETSGQSLQVSTTDKINIKYVDKTPLSGDVKEVLKTIDWLFQSTILKLDKTAYTGYNNSAKITLINLDLNKKIDKVEYIEVKAITPSNSIKLKLKETSVNSGEFSGTLYFGRSSNSSDGVIKVTAKDTVLISYTSKEDKNDTIECSSTWLPQNGQITLDRKEYKGSTAPVKITLKDWDIAEDPDVKDTVKVTARIQGSAKYTSVTLTETNKNSGTFTGLLYINGSGDNRPSITLTSADKLEVLYTDKDTTTGNAADRIVYTTWGGISEAKLTLDKKAYKAYDTYMTINLNDPDQNWSTTARDKVYVLVKAKSGKTNLVYTLTETGNNTGIFTVRLKFTKDAPSASKIRVMDDDKITVSFAEKEISVGAEFSE